MQYHSFKYWVNVYMNNIELFIFANYSLIIFKLTKSWEYNPTGGYYNIVGGFLYWSRAILRIAITLQRSINKKASSI